MLFNTCPIDSHQHVLIALGRQGHPTFKTIHEDESYLKKLGEELMSNKSQYVDHMVISSHNVYTLTHPDFVFDQAMDMIIRNLMLDKSNRSAHMDDF